MGGLGISGAGFSGMEAVNALSLISEVALGKTRKK